MSSPEESSGHSHANLWWGRSLRTKIIAWFFVPTALILIAVAVTNFFAYQDVTAELVIERDEDVTRLSASQLSNSLSEFTDTLEEVGRSIDTSQPPGPSRFPALQTIGRLSVFDGGVVVLDTFGAPVATLPDGSDGAFLEWSSLPLFRELRRSTRPVFSNVLIGREQDDAIVVVGVPILGSAGEFLGATLGMFNIGATSVSALYGRIVRIRLNDGGVVYVVDETGKVIYHSTIAFAGSDFSNEVAVVNVLASESGALRTTGGTGQDVVAAYSPVPGTPWSLISESPWSSLTSGSRDYQRLLLALLVIGILLPIAIVGVGIRRLMRPLDELISAAREVGAGNFSRTIESPSGDEIGLLATEFNRMAGALQESYANLEQRVATSTEDLRQTNQALQALIRSSPLPIMAIDRDSRVQMWNPASERVFGWTEEEVIGNLLPSVPPDQRDEFRAQLEPVWRGDVITNLEVQRQMKGGSLIDVGICAAPLQNAEGDITGVMSIISDLTERKQAEQSLRELAVLGERNRLARELHDVLGHALNLVVIQAGAAQRVFDSSPEKALDAMVSIESHGRQALSDVDRMLGILREADNGAETAPSLEARPSMSRIGSLVDEISATGQSVELNMAGTPSTLAPSIDLSAYRVVQEALTNVMTHAAGAKARVEIEYSEAFFKVTVTNDGSGVDKLVGRKSGGRGIIGMRERTAMFGGEFEAAPTDEGGWRVHATFPIEFSDAK